LLSPLLSRLGSVTLHVSAAITYEPVRSQYGLHGLESHSIDDRRMLVVGVFVWLTTRAGYRNSDTAAVLRSTISAAARRSFNPT
jgi:hypothetical protein